METQRPPYPAHSIYPASSVCDYSSSSVYIQGVRRSTQGSTRFSNRLMTPKAGCPEGPMIQHIVSPNESLEQPNRGDLDTSRTYNLLSLTYAAQARSGGGHRLKCSPKTSCWKYLISIDWMPWCCPGNVCGSGTTLHTSAENGSMSFPCRLVVCTYAFSAKMEHLSKVFCVPGQPFP